MDLGSGPGESNHLLPGQSFGARSPLSEFVAISRRLSHQLPFGSRVEESVHQGVHHSEGCASAKQLSDCYCGAKRRCRVISRACTPCKCATRLRHVPNWRANAKHRDSELQSRVAGVASSLIRKLALRSQPT